MDVPDTPNSRAEQLLGAIAGLGWDVPDEPNSRIESYLGAIAGLDWSVPDEPNSRIEALLELISQTPGGDVVLKNLSVDENGVYTSASGEAYKKVTVTVPQIDTETLNVTANGTYDAPSDTAYDEVIVNVPAPEPSLQDKSVTENGEVTADAGYDGLGTVTVAVPQGIPVEVSTAEGMAAALTAANVGKAYKYTGTSTDDYTQGDIYVVEEAS